MSDSDRDELQSRISRLEKKVERLEQKIEDALSASPRQSRRAENVDSTVKQSTGRPADRSEKTGWEEHFRLGEQWLNRIGIGLLLIGVAFLFKYSIDQGWLIPPVRSAIGLGTGVVLFVSGLQMKADIKPLKQILLGGGIAVFYITGFATFQLYEFMPSAIIWSFMIVVTLLSLSLSLQQDEAVLSVVGTLGALGTPFMLHTGGGSIVLLMVYTVLVLAGSIVVYMRMGWKSLLWSIALGGALVIFVGLINTAYYDEEATMREHWALQIGAVIWMLGAWMLPVARDVLSTSDLSRWPDPKLEIQNNAADEQISFSPSTSVHLMVFIVPLLMLVMVMGNWDISMDGSGAVAISLAAVGSAFYRPLAKRGLPKLASTHLFLGLIMLTIGFVLLLEGNFLFVVLAAEATALRFVAHQIGDAKISVSSHTLFGIVFFWILHSLYYSTGMASFVWGIESLTYLAAIVVGGTVIPQWLKKSDVQRIYQITSHLVFLFWIYHKYSGLENGQAWITVAWGGYAISLLVWGFVRYRKGVRLTGMGTIFLVVGKLFLVDLSQLEAVWRILLFIGFGAVFLLLGYYWQSNWNDEEQETGISNN